MNPIEVPVNFIKSGKRQTYRVYRSYQNTMIVKSLSVYDIYVHARRKYAQKSIHTFFPLRIINHSQSSG